MCQWLALVNCSTMGVFSGLILFIIVKSQVLVISSADSTCCQSCCGSDCKQVQPINICFPTVVQSQSIFDVVIVPSIPMFAGVDSMCWSFLNLTQDTYTLFDTEVYCNGLNFTNTYQVTQTSPGVLLFGSTLCNFQGTIFGNLVINDEGCNVILIYLCFLYGECDLEPADKSPVVIGLSPAGSTLSPICLYKASDLIDRAGFGTQDYNVLPMNQPCTCVTDYPQ